MQKCIQVSCVLSACVYNVERTEKNDNTFHLVSELFLKGVEHGTTSLRISPSFNNNKSSDLLELAILSICVPNTTKRSIESNYCGTFSSITTSSQTYVSVFPRIDALNSVYGS